MTQNTDTARNEAIRRWGGVILNEVKNLLPQQTRSLYPQTPSDCQPARLPACPPCHTPLPHAITSPYPVSMNPTRNAIRKLPTLSNVNTPALPCLLARLPASATAPRRLPLPLYDNRRCHDYFRICFPYPRKSWLDLALAFDITSETIRRKTTPTGTIDIALAASSTPLLTPEPIPGDRGSAQPPLRFVRYSPPTMVILRHLRFQTTGHLPLPVCPFALLPTCPSASLPSCPLAHRHGRTGNRSSLSI